MAETKGVSKSRLGRGLSSLIKVSVPVDEASVMVDKKPTVEATRPATAPVATEVITGKPIEVPVGDVKVNPHQPRKTFSEALLKELAESIKANGVIQPLVVKRVGSGYELVAGERRLRASKLAGLATVPCIVKDIDALTQAQMALVENIQREDLNPIERAEGYRTLMGQLGLTQAELAGRLGEDRSTIANHLRVLDLTEAVRKMLREGAISFGHAKLIAGMPDVLEQEKLAKLVVLQGLSVRNLEKVMAGRLVPPPPVASESAKAGRELHYQELEKSIARQLGFKVKLSGGKKGSGKVTIQYSNLDQFDQLMQRLRVDVD